MQTSQGTWKNERAKAQRLATDLFWAHVRPLGRTVTCTEAPGPAQRWCIVRAAISRAPLRISSFAPLGPVVEKRISEGTFGAVS